MTIPLAILAPSPARRVIATAMIGLTGVMLLSIALLQPPASFGWRIYLFGFGTLSIYLTFRLWNATAGQIVLTREGLFDGDGRCLCPLDNVESVERGTFAFKPSNGFLVHMRSPRPRGWAPGLWWSVGRRLGVGGVTPGAQGRIMADMLTMQVMECRGEAPAKKR